MPIDGVAALLRHCNLGLYAQTFSALAVDGEMLSDPTLTEEDLMELGVSIRLHRRRLLAVIAGTSRCGVPPEALVAERSDPYSGQQPQQQQPQQQRQQQLEEAEQQHQHQQRELWEAARLELLALEEQEAEEEGAEAESVRDILG